MRVWPLFNLALVIYCHAFSKYSVWQTMLLQESFENHMPSVEAACRILRMTGSTGDAATHIELQLVIILKNIKDELDLTLYITILQLVYFFRI